MTLCQYENIFPLLQYIKILDNEVNVKYYSIYSAYEEISGLQKEEYAKSDSGVDELRWKPFKNLWGFLRKKNSHNIYCERIHENNEMQKKKKKTDEFDGLLRK
ncbi:hypothetical protein POWCR01_000225100 [Plasmodium ovale]|uniref:Uncharacterized protein n=1 Tax=Plasmodium ovale TaxID=36330 RepID=A0A1C3KKK2_PLAOA|nr:hypothetical protein POWCR01_000225100 [Plasmodium ovale]